MQEKIGSLKPHVTLRLTDGEFDDMQGRLSIERERLALDLGQLFSLPCKRMPVFLHQPGGDSGCFEIMPCALGERHFVFLHGGFLHEGTLCEARFNTLHGSWTDRIGMVRNCRHVQNSIHEIVVSFTEPVDVGQIAPAAVRRHILLAEDDELSAEIIKVHLSESNATVEHVTNGRLAVDKGLEKRFDLIIMDLRMPEMDGLTATKSLREKGYDGRIVMLSAHTDEESRASALEAGCDIFIGKPFNPDEILKALNFSEEEPLVSTLAGSPTFQTIINRWVGQLPELVRALREARRSCDREKLEEIARELRSKGTACGFEPISLAAHTLESLLDSSESIESISCAVTKLENLCTLARMVDVPCPST